MPEKRPFERLPADVCPLNYGLCLKPDLIDFTFEGKLEAAVQAQSMLKILLSSEEFICYRSSLLLNPVLSAVWTTTDAS